MIHVLPSLIWSEAFNYSISKHRPLIKSQLMPGKTSRHVICVSPPAAVRSPSPSTSLWVPTKSLSGNAVIWSPECVADPCLFSACQLLPHGWLPHGFPQVSVADSCKRNSKWNTKLCKQNWSTTQTLLHTESHCENSSIIQWDYYWFNLLLSTIAGATYCL